eukprot:CAMPEP_0113474150 /NCGR_PEP_ID=MMETSP0014_2-20120614/18428_1 /TAXON_ID=2857 /ORGANISM="Nitzschia sp." /LENGTH=972 /DNA_ID=CAMNT_0000366973 /DNA_START=384 /DNA_END=3302 /DNA_ORIENTATION=+ /assembly_acc=CAM_ASM_000159
MVIGGNKILKHKRRYCKIEGCSRIVKSQGLCQRHGAKPKTCSVAGCTKQAQGNFDRMCKSHFKAMKREQTPIPKVVVSDSPPEPEGESVYTDILPRSIAYNQAAMIRGDTSPLVAHLKYGFDNHKPPAWHRNEERRARGIVQVENPATQLTGWERELVWMEILVLTGCPGASFRHLARAWGRDKGFHMVLAQFICDRHGDVERKGRQREKALNRSSITNKSSSNIVSETGPAATVAASRRAKQKKKRLPLSGKTTTSRSRTEKGPKKKKKQQKESDDGNDSGDDVWDTSMYDDVDMLDAIFDFDEDQMPKKSAHGQYADDDMSSSAPSTNTSTDLERKAAIAAILGDHDDGGGSRSHDYNATNTPVAQSTNVPLGHGQHVTQPSQQQQQQQQQHLQQQQQQQQQPHEITGMSFAAQTPHHVRQQSAGQELGAIDLVSFANSQGSQSLGSGQQQQLPQQQQQQQHHQQTQQQDHQNFNQPPVPGQQNEHDSGLEAMQGQKVPDHVRSSSELPQDLNHMNNSTNQLGCADRSREVHNQGQSTNETGLQPQFQNDSMQSVIPGQEIRQIEQSFVNGMPPSQPVQGGQSQFYDHQQSAGQDMTSIQPQMNGGMMNPPQQVHQQDETSDQNARVQRFLMEHPGEPVPSDAILRRLFSDGPESAPAPAPTQPPFAPTMAPAAAAQPQTTPLGYNNGQHQQQHSYQEPLALAPAPLQQGQHHRQNSFQEPQTVLPVAPLQGHHHHRQHSYQEPRTMAPAPPVQGQHHRQHSYQEPQMMAPAQSLQAPTMAPAPPLPQDPTQDLQQIQHRRQHSFQEPQMMTPSQSLQDPAMAPAPPLQAHTQDFQQGQHGRQQSYQDSLNHHQLDHQSTNYQHQQQQQQQPQPQWGQDGQAAPHFVAAQQLQQPTEGGMPMHPAGPAQPEDPQQNQHQGQPQVYDQPHTTMPNREDDQVVDPLDVHHAMQIEENNNPKNNGNGSSGHWA